MYRLKGKIYIYNYKDDINNLIIFICVIVNFTDSNTTLKVIVF